MTSSQSGTVFVDLGVATSGKQTWPSLLCRGLGMHPLSDHPGRSPLDCQSRRRPYPFQDLCTPAHQDCHPAAYPQLQSPEGFSNQCCTDVDGHVSCEHLSYQLKFCDIRCYIPGLSRTRKRTSSGKIMKCSIGKRGIICMW